jgi:hypothetical protein
MGDHCLSTLSTSYAVDHTRDSAGENRGRSASRPITAVTIGTPKQKLGARRSQFKRALDWAEAEGLIASHEIDDVVYLRLCSHEAGEPNEELARDTSIFAGERSVARLGVGSRFVRLSKSARRTRE